MPAVSVVIPTRDRSTLLRRAIASATRQTFADLEVIVVDDASTDETAQVVAEIAGVEPRLIYDRLPACAGGAGARNRGIALASGEWVAFLDDDDEWLDTKIETQLHAARCAGPGVGIVCCDMFLIDGESRRLIRCGTVSGTNGRRELLRRNVIGTSAVMIRRSTLQDVGGFDARLPRLQDWDLWLRVVTQTQTACVEQPLVRAWCIPDGISMSNDALIEACRILSRKYAHADFDRVEMSDFRYGIGHLLMVAGAAECGARELWQSVRLRPLPRRLLMAFLAGTAPQLYQKISEAHARIVDKTVAVTPSRNAQ